jgi:hypothetical protein
VTRRGRRAILEGQEATMHGNSLSAARCDSEPPIPDPVAPPIPPELPLSPDPPDIPPTPFDKPLEGPRPG